MTDNKNPYITRLENMTCLEDAFAFVREFPEKETISRELWLLMHRRIFDIETADGYTDRKRLQADAAKVDALPVRWRRIFQSLRSRNAREATYENNVPYIPATPDEAKRIAEEDRLADMVDTIRGMQCLDDAVKFAETFPKDAKFPKELWLHFYTRIYELMTTTHVSIGSMRLHPYIVRIDALPQQWQGIFRYVKRHT